MDCLKVYLLRILKILGTSGKLPKARVHPSTPEGAQGYGQFLGSLREIQGPCAAWASQGAQSKGLFLGSPGDLPWPLGPSHYILEMSSMKLKMKSSSGSADSLIISAHVPTSAQLAFYILVFDQQFIFVPTQICSTCFCNKNSKAT